MNAMMASQFFGSDRPAALRGGVGAVSVPSSATVRECGDNSGHGNLLRDIEAMRGKGGILFRVQLRMGLRQRFRVAKGGAEKKRRNKKLPARGNQTLSFASDLC